GRASTSVWPKGFWAGVRKSSWTTGYVARWSTSGTCARPDRLLGRLRALERHGASQSRVTQLQVLESHVSAQRGETERHDQCVEHQVGAAPYPEPVRDDRGVVRPEHGIDAGQHEY